MSQDMAEAAQQLINEKNYSEEAVRNIITDSIKAAYKRKFGTAENCIVTITDDFSDVSVYSRKVVVDGVYDPVSEIELEEAKEMSEEVEEGDEVDILLDPKTEFERSAVQTGKQTAHQQLAEIHKDSLFAEYKDKVGEIIIGYFQRQLPNGTIYVDLGKVEGVLPAKFQSDREVYHKNDRIKALVVDVKKPVSGSGVQIVLSRTDPEFVRNILELEVPEIYDGTVEIHKIVREAGYRTKMAVSSRREDVDPVGACVGLKGVRIKSVITELEGEKIDVLKYDPDPRVFIKNALSPAEVTGVVILDEDKRQALAVVPDSQFSLAIGKQGLNVRLANRLTDWSIDVKTEEQYEDSDSLLAESRRAAQELFNDNYTDDYDEITTVAELPGVDGRVAALLQEKGISQIEDFVQAVEAGSLASVEGLSTADIDGVMALINDSVEFVDDEAETESPAEETAAEEKTEADSEEEYYECPECGARITTDMTVCPNCGIGLSFEYEE